MAWQRGRAYAQDLRDRVLAASRRRLCEVAERFGVSPSYVSRAPTRRSRVGQVSPGTQVPSRAAALGQTQGLVAGSGGLGAGANTASIVPVGQIRARHVGRAHDHGKDLDSARFELAPLVLVLNRHQQSIQINHS